MEINSETGFKSQLWISRVALCALEVVHETTAPVEMLKEDFFGVFLTQTKVIYSLPGRHQFSQCWHRPKALAGIQVNLGRKGQVRDFHHPGAISPPRFHPQLHPRHPQGPFVPNPSFPAQGTGNGTGAAGCKRLTANRDTAPHRIPKSSHEKPVQGQTCCQPHFLHEVQNT